MIKVDGTNSQILFLAGTGNQTTLRAAPTSTLWTLTLPTGPGTSGQVLTTDGNGNLSWSAGGSSVTVADTTANATFYPMFSSITSGTLAVTNVSSTEYTFNPGTGRLAAPHMESSSGIALNANPISQSYTIPAGTNGLTAGPVTIPPGVVVTPSPGTTWKIC